MRRTLVTDSVTASFVEAGESDAGIRLACIHGAAHCGDVFRPLFLRPELAGTHRIAVDLPGRYGSIGAERSVTSDAAFVRSALAALPPASRTLVLGHSYGGAIALELALGGGVDSLVLVSTGARLRVRADILDSYERAARGEIEVPRGLGFSDSVDAEIVSALEVAFATVPTGASFDDWRSANAFDRMKDVGEIRTPTLILAGDDDPFTPIKYGEFLAQKIAHAELVTLTRGSHMAIVEDADRIAAAIARFAHIDSSSV